MFHSLLLGAILAAPVLAAEEEQPTARARGDLAIQVRDILNRYCAECHTGSPDPGKSKLKLLDHAQLLSTSRPIAAINPGAKSQVIELVRDGSMPPANRAAPTAAEIEALEKWAAAKAPEFPPAFDELYILDAIADDLERQQNAGKGTPAIERFRYVSFGHLIRDDHALPDLAEAERRLHAALALAIGEPVTLTAIDPPATIFRFDLTTSNWNARELFEKIDRRKPAGSHSLRPFDLLLLEYPFASQMPPGEDRLKRLSQFLSPANQVLPVPYLRGDWLAGMLASKDTLTPLGAELRSLQTLSRAIAMSQPSPDGPMVPRVLGTAQPLLLPGSNTGRPPIAPLSGWYTGNLSAEPPPFNLTAELLAEGQVVNSVLVDQRFKLKVQSDRRVYITLLQIQADGEARVQEIDGGSVLQANTPRELAPGPNGFSISGIITGGDETTEYFILLVSEDELPLPVIVRSSHPDQPIWRFLVDGGKNPEKVTRKVIPIHVKKKK